jgi:glucose-1-phosphate cytidylyltransferase
VGNINIGELVKFHQQHKKMCTVTSVQPSGRFGVLNIGENNAVHSFLEKPKGDGSWINGGYFVCEPGVFDFIEGDDTIWEKEPLEKLAGSGQMHAFKHDGFWRPMDTLKDKHDLNDMWESNEALWKIW